VKSVWLLLITSGISKGEYRWGRALTDAGDPMPLTCTPCVAFRTRGDAVEWADNDRQAGGTMLPVRFDVAKGKRGSK
jgi:hypothetical protein